MIADIMIATQLDNGAVSKETFENHNGNQIKDKRRRFRWLLRR
ncbi:MAG: hypothetical protein ACI90V_006775 [Bacillariaceae sp.]|jgi:hypothetical protein